MNLNTMSSSAICKEIGQRLKRARLNANRTQKEVADRAGLSVTAVQSVERGDARMESVVLVLMALDMVEQISNFVPEQEISPLQLVKLQGKKRQRASGRLKDASPRKVSEW
jgi:putative transcriptional regulator